jgi:hypothetical protein
MKLLMENANYWNGIHKNLIMGMNNIDVEHDVF